jgi:hypothetical protein
MPLAASITSKESLPHFQPSWVTGLAQSFYVLSSSDLHYLCSIFCPPDTDSRASRAISLQITVSLVFFSISLHFCPPDTDSRASRATHYLLLVVILSAPFLSPGHGLKTGHFSIHHLLCGWHSPLFFVFPGHGLKIISNREMEKGIYVAKFIVHLWAGEPERIGRSVKDSSDRKQCQMSLSKKLICKGTLRKVFICLRPHPP